MLDKIKITGKLTLKEIRTLTGMTQEEFAEHVEIPYRTYRRCEMDISKMEVANLFKIAEKLEISVDVFKRP